jgi:4-hydroxy-tetrahydrodipicolinate reductase
LQALSRGRPFLFLEHINYVLKDLGHCTKPWSKPNAPTTAYRIEVHGDPKYDLELQCAQPSQWCATPVINCIPAVVAAPPGLVRPRDVPRSWSRNVTARLGRWP